MFNYKKYAAFALLPIASIALWTQAALAETLNTDNFEIKITRNCPEGSVTCDDVTYYGRDLNTGNHITLTGKTIQRLCADGVTPCQFLGYEFRNRNYIYQITENGRLLIYKNHKLILNQQGTFDYQ